MDQETLKNLEKRAISDAEDYFDALAKARPELTKPVVAKLAIVAAIESRRPFSDVLSRKNWEGLRIS